VSAETPSSLPEAMPLDRLPQTARELLAAARKIVLRDGLHCLTLQAIQDETGHNKAMVNHYFGSKAGLVAALFDSLAHDQEIQLRRQIARLRDARSRVQALVEMQRETSADVRAMQTYCELLPHMLRDRRLRWRLAALYEGFRRLDEWALTGSDADPQAARLDDLAAVALAVTDGLGIQAAADPDLFSATGPYQVWEEMLRLYLEAHHPQQRRRRLDRPRRADAGPR
jgi:AcrR family transcriptional regulator